MRSKHKVAFAVAAFAVILTVALIAGTAVASGGGDGARLRDRTCHEATEETSDRVEQGKVDRDRARARLQDESCDVPGAVAAAGSPQGEAGDQDRGRERLRDETCEPAGSRGEAEGDPVCDQQQDGTCEQAREQNREEAREQKRDQAREQKRDCDLTPEDEEVPEE